MGFPERGVPASSPAQANWDERVALGLSNSSSSLSPEAPAGYSVPKPPVLMSLYFHF